MFNSNKFFQVISGFIAFGFTILQGLDWLFKKYSIDSKWFNYIVIGLFIAFIASLLILFIKSRKAENQKPKSNDKKSKLLRIANVLFTGLFSASILLYLRFNYLTKKLITNNN